MLLLCARVLGAVGARLLSARSWEGSRAGSALPAGPPPLCALATKWQPVQALPLAAGLWRMGGGSASDDERGVMATMLVDVDAFGVR